ncbi:hypothetical protein ACFXKD_27725 [Nocardiopsis aegyptia]|uniref:hypothetical protein n=1 Tax=Nocardiopsis aegyptia TaxID=220378 RepID=UPI00366C5643
MQSLNQPVEHQILTHTHLGNHATIRTLILRARIEGTEVVHEHDGRLIVRTHLLTLTGHPEPLRRFQSALSRYWRAQAAGMTALDLRRDDRRREQRMQDGINQLFDNMTQAQEGSSR